METNTVTVTPVETATPAAEAEAQDTATSEATPAVDATAKAPEPPKPVAPAEDPKIRARFAELARQKREVLALQQTVKAAETELASYRDMKGKAKENPAAVLEALGLDFETVLGFYAGQAREPGPEDRIARLEKEILDRKAADEAAQKTQEQQRVTSAINGHIEKLKAVATGNAEKFPLTSHYGAYEDALDVMALHYDQTKQHITHERALELVEEALLLEVTPLIPKLTRTVKDKATPESHGNGSETTLTNSAASSAPAVSGDTPWHELDADEFKRRIAARLG